MDLSIVIVNFNVKFFLEQALYSVLKASSTLTIEIIVVDNNSTDGSREYLSPKFPEVNFIWNNSNTGFATSCNLGLQIAKGEFVLFLNPDTIIPEDCFTKCIDYIKSKHDCGALGVKMIDGSGSFLKESKRGFPGASASFFRLSGLTFLFPKSKIISAYYAGHLSKDESHEIDIIAGAFFMTRKEILDKVGGFDPQFFMYGEDIDLSYRIKLAGYKNYYFSQTSIIHFKGESTKKGNSYNKIFYKAMHLFVNKHYKGLYKIPMHFAIKTGKIFSLIKLKIKGEKDSRKQFSPVNIAVIANPESFAKLEKLLRYSNEKINKIYKIPIVTESVELENFLSEVNTNSINQILFSEGNLSFKKIINFIEKKSNLYKFLFHSYKSRSIIWSEDKNENGNFIFDESTSQEDY